MQFPDGPRDLGLLTTTEALLPRAQGGLGLTHRALRWRVDSGRWQRLHSGVYLMSSGPVDWITRAGAALLAYGDAAALCDRSAGYLHGLVDDPGTVVHVLVPRAARPHEHAGTRLHRSDRRPIIPAWPARTSYEATVVDLATSSRVDDLASLLASALRTRRTTEARIGMALQRPTRSGCCSWTCWGRHRRARLGRWSSGSSAMCYVGMRSRWAWGSSQPLGWGLPLARMSRVWRGRSLLAGRPMPVSRIGAVSTGRSPGIGCSSS